MLLTCFLSHGGNVVPGLGGSEQLSCQIHVQADCRVIIITVHANSEYLIILIFTSFNYTVAYGVHIGVSDMFPTQPLLGASTRLNCSVTPNPQLNHTFLTIQYQWYTNSTLIGSGQELVLPNLSPADATRYSCIVTISSSNPTLLIRQISNQSTYELAIKSKQ